MQKWLRQLGPSALAGLWYLFGVLIYRMVRHRPPPGWSDLPDYLATYAGFVLASATMVWWRGRRKPPR